MSLANNLGLVGIDPNNNTVQVSGFSGGGGGGGGDRNSAVIHRSAVTAADKLAQGGTVTLSAITEAGSNLTAVATYATICPGNRYGNGTPSTVVTITPTANQAVRLAFAQVVGAEYYDIFLGLTSGAPLWVGRITEAQRATGDRIISTVGTLTARAGSTVAGTIDVGIVGTGLASNVAPFTSNNAYIIGTPIDCDGYAVAHIQVTVTVTDLRSLPALTLIPFFINEAGSGNFHQGEIKALSLLSASGYSLIQDFELDVDGSTGLFIPVDSISGQGASVDIVVSLAK